jgi:MFS family permease
VRFLWAPLLDLGAHRKVWFVSMTVLTAVGLALLALFPDPAKRLALFTALSTIVQIAAGTSCAAADGLMACTTRDEDKGKAGGWRMAGNVGGTGVLGAVPLWVASVSNMTLAGLSLGVLVLATAATVLFIDEPHPIEPEAAQADTLPRVLLAHFHAIGRDLLNTLKSREGWTGLVICLMPVGAGALTNLFSAMAGDYRASEQTVAMVNGLGGGLTGAAGALLGGWLADRMNRRLAYALSGGLTALSGIAMMAAPMNPTTYTWGTLLYNFMNGIAFAALAAFILEMVGHSVAATTKYTTFIAVANVASSYVTAADGWASEFRGLGSRGALAFDAILTFAGISVLLVMMRFTRARPAPVLGPAAGT